MPNTLPTAADEKYLEDRMDQLVDAQADYAGELGAEIYNLGWYADAAGGRLESKTDMGIIISQIEKDGSISHRTVA